MQAPLEPTGETPSVQGSKAETQIIVGLEQGQWSHGCEQPC